MEEMIEKRIKRMQARVKEIDARIKEEYDDTFRMYLRGCRDELNYEIAMLEIDLMFYGKGTK